MKKNLKFKIGDISRVSKYKKSFAKVSFPSLKKFLWIKKLKKQCRGEKIVEWRRNCWDFAKKNCKK